MIMEKSTELSWNLDITDLTAGVLLDLKWFIGNYTPQEYSKEYNMFSYDWK